MEDIKKVFAIQWVGPFKTLDEMKSYLKNPATCDESLFCFYYFRGNKKGAGHPSAKYYNYLGITNQRSIADRLCKSHEHYKDFHENDNMRIWIGTFSDVAKQTPENIADVETVLISTYRRSFTENISKKLSPLRESVCIINLWYKPDETPYKCKKVDVRHFDDVLVYEKDINSFCVGSLKKGVGYISE